MKLAISPQRRVCCSQTQTRRRFLTTLLERPVLDDFSKQDVQPNFVAQLSGHKNLRNVCYPESWARYIRSVRRNQVGTSTTTQQNVFTVQQIQPQAIFAGAHIDKFEGCTFNINVFCGDQSKIARLNENWSLSDRGTNRHYLHCSCTLIWSLFINCCFNHKFFHWACMKKFDEVCTKLDFEQLFLSRLDWRPVTEESQLNAWARAGKQINLVMFLFLCFLV